MHVGPSQVHQFFVSPGNISFHHLSHLQQVWVLSMSIGVSICVMCCQIDEDVFWICLSFVCLHVFS